MDARDLYGLPLERFVAERTALAKALRSEGKRDEAASVAKLAKPSVPAWAVNQLVRTQHRAFAELLDAGDALQRAQADVIAGQGSASALREAADRERAAVRTLSAAARGLLTSDGHGLTPATLERVTETLHAVALEPAARDEAREGCLTRELKHIGLGAAPSGLVPVPATTGTRQRANQATERAKREAGQEAAKADRERQAERERAARLAAARKTEAEARRSAERAALEVQQAQQRRDRAAASLREAEQALGEAEDRAAQAARAHEQAQRDVERA